MKKSLLVLGISLALSSAVKAEVTCPDAGSVATALYSNDSAITSIIQGAIQGVDSAYISNKITLTLTPTETDCHYNLGDTKLKLLTIKPSATPPGARKGKR